MEDILEKLVVVLVGGIVTWLVSKHYNRPRLYCALQRLYEYSNYLDNSHLVQLVIVNRGRKSEESVEVQLSTDYDYLLLAATQNSVEISKERLIKLPVMLPKSEVSLIFAAEGKPRFSKDSIRYIRSKGSSGNVGTTIAEAEASSPGMLLNAIVLLVVIAFFGYLFGRTVGEDAWRWGSQKITPTIEQKYKEGCVNAFSNGARKATKESLSEDVLKKIAVSFIKVKSVSIQGKTLLVDVEAENPIGVPVNYSIKLLSHASDSTTEWSYKSNKYVYDIVMENKGEKRSYLLSDYFPADRTPKRFWLEVRIELLGYWVTMKRSYFFGSDASKTCSSADD